MKQYEIFPEYLFNTSVARSAFFTNWDVNKPHRQLNTFEATLPDTRRKTVNMQVSGNFQMGSHGTTLKFPKKKKHIRPYFL